MIEPRSDSTFTGRRLGSYQVAELLGAGGMGEVYRARDMKLGREVAIKILPRAFSSDPERLARFEREARVLASLNHPHIGAIYGVEDVDGINALVLELVEGETLADRLHGRPVPIVESLSIARQIAGALEAAHEKGIVHRDLKPANIKTTPDGVVKVLDFGLAKAVAGDGSAAALMESPTITAAGTRDGVILGTAAYMSPEQARGKAVDRRADLWAFGAVLYEMVTGQRAFTGDNVSDTIAHVLTREPDWTALPAMTPAPLRTLLRRCLDKDRQRRLDSATAARLDLDEALAALTSETPAPVQAVKVKRGRVALALALIALLAATAVVASLVTRALVRAANRVPAVPSQFLMLPPTEQSLGVTYSFLDVALSPDGRHLAYYSGPPSGDGRLMLRALDQLDARPVPGIVSAKSPFFSPDGQWIGFFEADAMKKVAVTGGPVFTLGRHLGSPQGGSWGDGGTIVFSAETPNQGLMALSANGGEARALTKTEATQNEIAHAFPSVLPGERGVLFTVVGASDQRQLAVLDLRTGRRKTLLGAGLGAAYVDTGHVVYEAFGTLFAIGFDLDRLEVQGEPVPLRQNLRVGFNRAPKHSVSRAGTLV